MFKRCVTKFTAWPYCPNHREEPVCGCGENTMCHACGFGTGIYPCTCMREHDRHTELLNKSLGIYNDLWIALAGK